MAQYILAQDSNIFTDLKAKLLVEKKSQKKDYDDNDED
jgi:hypothetical protein